MTTPEHPYAARLDIEYPEELDRLTSFFRLIWIIPIMIILTLISAASSWSVVTETGETISRSSGGIASGLFVATMLMIVFRERYPRWWFDFAREFARFATRVGAYFLLLTDRYPSTVEEQSVHLEIDYPDVEEDLNIRGRQPNRIDDIRGGIRIDRAASQQVRTGNADARSVGQRRGRGRAHR